MLGVTVGDDARDVATSECTILGNILTAEAR